MSDKKMYYRCEWTTGWQGVCVQEFFSSKAAQEAGWYPTLDEAKREEANRMRRLANDLLRQADALTRDRRSK